MTDMTKTIEPKSNQLNADDLLGGRSITIKITKITGMSGEQPIALNFEGDNNKPYFPCKSMRRVLVNVWGKDGQAYVGRSMTLYRDEKVTFGGIAVGGIRISHMSHIDKEITMALTASKTCRKPYTVRPLKVQTEETSEVLKLSLEAQAAAERGTDTLKAFWDRLTNQQKKKMQGKMDELKKTASAFDNLADDETITNAEDQFNPPQDADTYNQATA